jgi:hypothetical protein
MTRKRSDDRTRPPLPPETANPETIIAIPVRPLLPDGGGPRVVGVSTDAPPEVIADYIHGPTWVIRRKSDPEHKAVAL